MDAKLICVVDDEVSIIDFVRIYLEREKISVIAYMDGYDVCRTLRAEENEEPIIMLSAKDEDIDKILGLRVGCRCLSYKARSQS